LFSDFHAEVLHSAWFCCCFVRENVVTGDIRDVDPEEAGKTRRMMRRRISIRVRPSTSVSFLLRSHVMLMF
jgi:hypothetical protein